MFTSQLLLLNKDSQITECCKLYKHNRGWHVCKYKNEVIQMKFFSALTKINIYIDVVKFQTTLCTIYAYFFILFIYFTHTYILTNNQPYQFRPPQLYIFAYTFHYLQGAYVCFGHISSFMIYIIYTLIISFHITVNWTIRKWDCGV